MEKQSNEANKSLYGYICEGTPADIVQRYAGLVDAAAKTDFGELDRDIVVLDTETTGLSYTHDELIQIAAARMERGKIVDWFVTFVDPGRFLSEETMHLTHISEQDLIGAPSPDEALGALVEFVGESKIVAHNVSFDRTFCTKYAAGYPLLENWWIDTLDLAKIALPRLKSHRLLDLVRAFDAPLSTHRADADVEATCAILRVLFAAIAAMPQPLVQRISEFCSFEDWPTGRVFELLARQCGEALRQDARAEASPAEEPDGSQGLRTAGAEQGFSLRAIRRSRARSHESAPRKDAEELAADPFAGLDCPTQQEIAEAFSPNGPIAQLFEEYELREEQLEMSQAVGKAFAASENLVVEAGTGVGKSLAYLVPAALLAKRNGITVGIATKTNALLDQLVFKELPLLRQAFGTLDFVPLKGMTHYPCMRRIENLLDTDLSPREVEGKTLRPAPAMASLLSFVEQSDFDDIDGLKIDFRSLPRRSVTTTSHECLRRKCPYFGKGCMAHGARRRAESADIVVTNHSLLFCDLAADGSLLPPVRHWIIDEAHGAEAEARKAFSVELAAEEIMRIARRVAATEPSRNPFVRAERFAAAGEQTLGETSTLLFALLGKAREEGRLFAEEVDAFVPRMKDLLYFDDTHRGKSYETVDLWLNESIRGSETFKGLAQQARIFARQSERLVAASQNVVAVLEEHDNAAAVQRDIAAMTLLVKEMIQAIEVVFGEQNDSLVYSATLNRRKERQTDALQASVLNVGDSLEKTLFERTHSVVFASATVTVDGSFESFANALGLNTCDNARSHFLMLDSSFDFDGNMTIFVPNDLPEPTMPSYLRALQNLLIKAHRAQQGSMLTLFTNRREMEQCFDEVAPELAADGLRVVCQKWGVSVKGLRDDFLADEHVSLFALKSFWEGFDAPGSTLKGVIIPKLPFSKPSDPLSRERALRDSSAWRHYDLPAAVIETKQAVGRLIRKADDRGIVILADTRLISKGYGKIFLRSMPSKNIRICSCDEIARALENAEQR